MDIIKQINQAVMKGDDQQVISLVNRTLEEKVKISTVINQGLIEAMSVVGSKMASGEMFVPEVLMSARAMKAGLEILKPLMESGDMDNYGTVLIGTVKGDLHDIGKNLVAMMLESSGFEVIDLGVDLTKEAFINAVQEHKPEVIGLSALLTTTMPAMRDTIETLRECGVKSKIVVGGAPVSESFAQEVGADGYAADAAGAVVLVKRLAKKE